MNTTITLLGMRKTIDDLFEQFLQEWEFTRRAKKSTLRGFVQAIKLFRNLLPDVTIETLTVASVTQFFRVLQQRKRSVGKGIIKTGVKNSTVRNYWSKLNTFFEWLYVHHYLSENPFRFMRLPPLVWDDVKFLKKEQIERIFNVLHNPVNPRTILAKRNLAMFYVFLFCGLRKEELLQLQVRDVDLERKILTVRAETSKIPRTRQIPLHTTTVMYLTDYLRERRQKQTPFLFVSNSRDDRISTNGLTDIVTELKKRSGVRFHLHQLRHTFAVNFLKSSNNVVKLKQLLGHTDIKMTLVYVRCLPTNELRADVQHMRIDEFV